ARAGIDVGNLADGENLVAGRCSAVEQGRLGRRHGEIPAIAGAFEIFRILTDEGSGDDAADAQRRRHRKGDLADAIEPVEAEMAFVRGDLEDTVDGGVADGLAG